MDPKTHRKRVKHIDHPGHAHELTFSCYRRFQLLQIPGTASLLAEAIGRATEGKGYDLLAYVIMPEHVHLVVYPLAGCASISALLAAIKRPSSYRVKKMLQERDVHWLRRLVIRERRDRNVFRFWQEGSGYDRNLHEPETLRKAIQYVHENPVRRNLCAAASDWRWSSWREYHETEGLEGRVPAVKRWTF